MNFFASQEERGAEAVRENPVFHVIDDYAHTDEAVLAARDAAWTLGARREFSLKEDNVFAHRVHELMVQHEVAHLFARNFGR